MRLPASCFTPTRRTPLYVLLHGNNLDVTLTHYRRCTSNTHEVGSTGNPFTPKLPLSTRTTTLTGQTGRRTVGQRYEGVTQIKATLLRTHFSYVTAAAVATCGRVALSTAYPYRAVTGGKTTKIEVLAGFCKNRTRWCQRRRAADMVASLVVLLVKNQPWRP